MKKLLFVAFVVLSLTACQFIQEEEEESPRPSQKSEAYNLTPSKSASFEVTSANNVFVVTPETANVTLTGNLSGKTIYYATVNSGVKSISNEYVRYVAGSSSRAAVSEKASVFESNSKSSNHVVYHDEFIPVFDKDSSRAVSSVNPVAERLVCETGVTTKDVYVAVARGSYQLKKAGLYASDSICNVWILEDDASIPASERSQLAAIYVKRFASVYQKIRNVFGEESDSIYVSTKGSLASMESASATGKKINIVVYDLYGDSDNGGTIGLFSSTDYYKNGLSFSNGTINRSNEGKYIYIDSFFAEYYFDYTVSTFAHEYQHMINYGMKTMKGLDCDSNLNEMLSMLCEDMVQSTLGISDEYSPKNRIHKFLASYYDAGIREYNDTLQAYANAYAFGAWLVRNYGGNALLHEMLHNKKSNNECIIAAVNTINGTNYSFDSLFALFIKACFDYEDAPKIFDNNVVGNVAASYGMFLKSYGDANPADGSVKLNFASNSGLTNSGLITYIYVK